MAKPKMGVKSIDSDHAYLLDFRVCHQNKTKLNYLLLVVICVFSVLWCDILYFVTQQNFNKSITAHKINPSQGGQYCGITPLEEGVAPACGPTICEARLYAVPLPPWHRPVALQYVRPDFMRCCSLLQNTLL